MNNLGEAVWMFFLLVLAPLTFIVGVAWAAVAWDCSGYAGATGRPTKMAALTCYVQDDRNVWMTAEQYSRRIGLKVEIEK